MSESESENRIRVAMIIELSSYSKIIPFQNPGGMGTIVPLWIEELEKLGCEVVVDRADFDYDILHLHNPLPKSIYLGIMGKLKGKKIVVHGHHLPELIKGGFKGASILYPLNRIYSRFFFNLGDVLVAPSPFAMRSLRKLGVKGPFEVVFNGVDRTKFKKNPELAKKFREKFRIESDEFVVVSVGLRIPRKGVDTFIETAAEFQRRYPDSKVRFVWIGGSEPLLVDAMPGGKLPENVLFTGYISFELLIGGYSNSGAFMLPTRAESYGNVVLEAASMGLPIILRDIPAFDDWLETGKNCLKCASTEDFVRAVRMISSDETMRSILINGSNKLAEEHDIRNTGRRLFEIYRRLIAEDRSRS
ncbi:MAG: glycosyltransferase family 4 protein [Thermoplasmata archaeon]